MPIANIAEIRASIVRSEDLLVEGVPIQLDVKTANRTNCYAYSMGITYNTFPDGRHFYVPGFTEERMYDFESQKSLIENIRKDLKNIGIKFQEYQLNENPEIGENEYLVKLFYSEPSKYNGSGDFHFVRQDRKSGKWFHKMGWRSQPEIIKPVSQYKQEEPGSEPKTIVRCDPFMEVYTYNPVCYFVITES